MSLALDREVRRLACAGLGMGMAFASLSAPAQNTPTTSPEVVARYEQILEREPEEGVSFDKLLQIYEQGDGLEKLDARWAPLSSPGGAKGATYSLLRGLLADRMGKTDVARTLLQAATTAAQDDYHAWMALGDFEAREGHLTDAITAFQKGLGTSVTGEDQLSLYRKLGQAQERNLDGTGALATWQKMTAAFPKNAFALEEAGAAELDAQQYDDARRTFQKLVDLAEPNSMNRVQALMKLAGVDDRQGKTDDAVHGYEAILPLTAESSWLNREIRAQIEQVYRRQDDLAGLVGYYKKWVDANPRDVEALLLYSSALSELGKNDDALDTLRKASVLAPDRHEVRQSLAERLVETKQYDEAIKVETALTADDPTEPRYWATLGEALWSKTQPPTPESKKAVLDAWAKIAPADSKDVAAILEVADLCAAHDLNDEALAGYNRALAITPDATDIREKAVKLLVDLKRQDEAWKLLDAMAEGTGATAANYIKLAQIDERLDRKDASAAAIQKGLALEPANFDLLSLEWSRLAEAQKWTDAIALFDKLLAAAPNAYFIDQVEARQVQALISAGKLDEVEKPLHDRLGGQPPLTEAELRLLTRMMVQQNDAETDKAFDEAQKRFPQSVGLLQLEVDYARHQDKDDEAVAGLRRMIALNPQQKADFLTEIVRIRQDQGNFDDALKTAQEIIDASPASTPGYLLYADVAFTAGKNDDGVARLQTAIKLSEKPNDVRQRLARHDMETGEPAKAQAVYNDAFAAADNPQDRLTIVRDMAQAYFQTGQVDDLIAHFKQEQNSEDGGWRFGLYLSAIYEEMQDFGAARQELAKSLAVRPKDTALIKSLIGLANKEGDPAEVLRYREMMVAADPAPANQLALATEYAQQGKPKDAWRVVQANQADVMKEPLEWKAVLNEITDPAYVGKFEELLETAIRAKNSAPEGALALAQFQMQQRNLDAAKKTLWDILVLPLPVTPSAPKPPAHSQNPLMGFYQGKTMQRVQQTYQIISDANMYLTPQSPMQNRYGGIRRMSQMGLVQGMGMPGVSTTLDPQAVQDHALVYLAAIAVQEKKSDDFLRDLQAKFDAWHWSLSQRIVAYALVQARAPLFDAIVEQANTGKPDPEIDQLCVNELSQFANPGADPDMAKRMHAPLEILTSRVAKEFPQTKMMLALQKVYGQGNVMTPAGVAERKKALADYLAEVDPKDPLAVITAIPLASSIPDWDAVQKYIGILTAMDRTHLPVMATQQLNWLPMNLATTLNVNAAVQAASTDKGKKPAPDPRRVDFILDLLALSYPEHPPGAGMAATTGSMGMFGRMGMYGQNTFPMPNRYYSADRLQVLQQIYNGLKQQTLVPAFEQELTARTKSTTDWRQIYPTMALIYIQWWNGEKDTAVASTRDLLAKNPTDEFRLMLASMLTEQQKYTDALPVLEAVTFRYGPQYIQTQMQLLHTAQLAKDNEKAHKAADRLLAMRLPQEQQNQITPDLQAIGMQDKVQAIQARQQRLYNPGGSNMQANMQSVQTMQQALNNNNDATALDIAHQLLNQDPTASLASGNGDYATREAIQALQRMDQLTDYLVDLDKQLEANPKSLRLNWIAAQAYRQMSRSESSGAMGLGPMPQWLKLQRTGDHWEGFYSPDGVTWTSLGTVDLPLGNKVYLGLEMPVIDSEIPLASIFDEVKLAGKITPADAPASPLPTTNSPAPITPASTNATPVAATPPATPASDFASWQQTDMDPSSSSAPPNSTLTSRPNIHSRHMARQGELHFVYQMLEGDGSVIIRVKDLPTNYNNRPGQFGLLASGSLDPHDPQVGIAFSPSLGVVWHSRGADKNNRMKAVTQNKLPLWLKLTRTGRSFTVSTSTDGQTWHVIRGPELVLMKEDAQVGLFTTTHGRTTGNVVWKNVRLTGTAAAPAANPTPTQPNLPAPWQSEKIGEGDNIATPQFTGSDLTFSIPGSATPTGSNAPLTTFIYQTIHGDGEIVAQLNEIPNTGRWSGITFRAGPEANSPEMTVYAEPPGRLGFTARSNGDDASLEYYRKVAEMQPGNVALLVQIAQQLSQENKPDEAANLYATVLKTDANAAMNNVSLMEKLFEQTGRLKELVSLIQAWNPPPPNPMGGQMANTYQLTQLGDLLRQSGDMAEAEAIYRKMLTLDSQQPKDETETSLVQTLVAEGRKDDAIAEMDRFIFTTSSPPPPPLLGMNYNNSFNNYWLMSMGWNQDGPTLSPRIKLLEIADELGYTPKLKSELQAKVDAAKSDSATATASITNGIDPNRLMLVLLSIITGDKDAGAQLQKYRKEQVNSNFNASVILAEELVRRPAMRPLAITFLEELGKDPNMMQNPTLFIALDRMTEKMAEQADDHALLVKTLKKELQDFTTARGTNVGFVSIDQELALVHSLLHAGLLKEATDELAQARTNPQIANNTYYNTRLDETQAEITAAGGKTEFTDVAFGYFPADEKNKHDQISWCLTTSKPQRNGNMLEGGLWNNDAEARPTRQTLIVQAGSDNHFTTIATLPQVATRGLAPLKIPAGTSMIRAILLPVSCTPEAKASLLLLDSSVPTGPRRALVGAGPNLLKNPDFAVTKSAAGLPEVTGWNGVWPDSIMPAKGSPAPDHAYRSVALGGQGGMTTVASDRIAVQPGSTYLVTGILRGSANVGVRYLSSDGKQISENNFGGGNNDNAWRLLSWTVGQSTGGVNPVTSFPANTAFLELTFQAGQNWDVAGLSVHAWPPPPAPAAPVVKH